jgi:hypothetical protein
VICAYQVVQEVGRHGDQTTYSQQVRMMRLEGQLKPDPLQQFITDMKSLIKKLHDGGNDIILMGDFKESIGANPSGMASVMTEGELLDVFCHRHRLGQEKTTYAQGTTRVDYIMTTPQIIRVSLWIFPVRVSSSKLQMSWPNFTHVI